MHAFWEVEEVSVDDLYTELLWLDRWLHIVRTGATYRSSGGVNALIEAIVATQGYLRGERGGALLLPHDEMSVARAWMDATGALNSSNRAVAARCYQVSLDFAKAQKLSCGERSRILALWRAQRPDFDGCSPV
jgi:hypothetical protein